MNKFRKIIKPLAILLVSSCTIAYAV
ncbi:MAG: hypothetical protein K0R94_1047, partial [Burkholderiales bacterium]|nr:hypothetical protein [Burkholderiales bacterium]